MPESANFGVYLHNIVRWWSVGLAGVDDKQ